MYHILTDEEYKDLLKKASRYEKKERQIRKEVEKELKRKHLDYKAEYEVYKNSYERANSNQLQYSITLKRQEEIIKKYNKSGFWYRMLHPVMLITKWEN